MKSLKLDQLTEAIQSLSTERNVPEETIFKAVESAFAAAWRRDKGERGQDVTAKFNINTGELEIFTNFEVVEKDEDIEDDLRQLLLEDAKKIDKTAKVGGSVQQQQDVPEDFGRIAAQTAKQAIIQSLKESESEIMVEEYKDRVGTVINGSIQRVESRFVRVDLGRTSAIMPREEQIPGERYNMGERLKFYIKEIDDEGRIPTMIVSRSAPELVVALFKQEVPEIGDGAVQIKGIARSAGLRTKVSVFTDIPGVDAAGTLIGGHGVRVKAVNAEVGETERIDIVEYSDNLAEYITRAMSPAKIDGIKINEENKTAQVFVSEDEVRIAIGRGGANVRLAGQLTDCEIEVERPESTETPEDEKKDSKTSEEVRKRRSS
jgi:N utilization substance protein A